MTSSASEHHRKQSFHHIYTLFKCFSFSFGVRTHIKEVHAGTFPPTPPKLWSHDSGCSQLKFMLGELINLRVTSAAYKEGERPLEVGGACWDQFMRHNGDGGETQTNRRRLNQRSTTHDGVMSCGFLNASVDFSQQLTVDRCVYIFLDSGCFFFTCFILRSHQARHVAAASG